MCSSIIHVYIYSAEHRMALEGVMNEKCELEERWRKDGEEWRERVENLEEKEREKIVELNRMEGRLAHEAEERSGRNLIWREGGKGWLSGLVEYLYGNAL